MMLRNVIQGACWTVKGLGIWRTFFLKFTLGFGPQCDVRAPSCEANQLAGFLANMDVDGTSTLVFEGKMTF